MMKEPGTLAGYAAYLAARTRQTTVYLDLGREMMALSGIVTGADGEWLLLSGERGRNLCATGALVRLDMEGPAGSRGENEDLLDRSEEILVLESSSGSRSRWERKALLLLEELP